jgi:hypothetical protein
MNVEFIQHDHDIVDEDTVIINATSMYINGERVITDIDEDNIGEIAKVIFEKLGIKDFKISQSWD